MAPEAAHSGIGWRKSALVVAGLMAAAASALWLMGRSLICTCGAVKLWHGDINSAENSQQLLDWYSPTHVLHGVAFHALTWLAVRLGLVRWSTPARLVAAVAVECGWEVMENSTFIIERYRAATIGTGYFGDSILNSQSDITMMIVGFILAWRLPVASSLLLFAGVELLLLAVIRDNLSLNLLMLTWPLESIRQWQAGV